MSGNGSGESPATPTQTNDSPRPGSRHTPRTPPTGGPDLEMEGRETPEKEAHPRTGEEDATESGEMQEGQKFRRGLNGYHIAMITISGTLGVGLYIRTGYILRLAGPFAVPISFVLVGILAWAVMQCIAELICIFPIPGALPKIISRLLNKELGVTVGLAYWFTYAISFSATITAIANEAQYWTSIPGGVQAIIFFMGIPALLVVLNCCPLEVYGTSELVGGVLKIAFVIVTFCILFAINMGASPEGCLGFDFWREDVIPTIRVYDNGVAHTWCYAFFTSMSTAAFAYVGVEIPSAIVLEAKIPRESRGRAPKAIRISATVLPVVIGLAYFAMSFMATFDMRWDDGGLPRAAWLDPDHQNGTSVIGARDTKKGVNSSSVFVLIAEKNSRALASAVNAFILLTALFSANTNLYVSSRTLFGLMNGMPRIDPEPGDSWTRKLEALVLNTLAVFGKTNQKGLPVRAVLASCAFGWVPFLSLISPASPGTTLASLFEVLSEMGAVSCIMVWACACLAYLQFHYTLRKPGIRAALHCYAQRDRPNYPYRSHGQPMCAWLALVGCVFIIVVANSAPLWSKPKDLGWLTTSLQAFLAPGLFLATWLILTWIHQRRFLPEFVIFPDAAEGETGIDASSRNFVYQVKALEES